MASLFSDADFPFPGVAELRALGHYVLTTSEAGLADVGTPDPDILAKAVSLGRAVVTMNKPDFIALHNSGTAHAGVIVCSRDEDYPALAQRIHSAISSVSGLSGRLVRVNKPNVPPARSP